MELVHLDSQCPIAVVHDRGGANKPTICLLKQVASSLKEDLLEKLKPQSRNQAIPDVMNSVQLVLF